MDKHILFSQISLKELSDLIRDAVSEELNRTSKTDQIDPSNYGPELLSLEEAADYFNVCKSTIHNWRVQRKLPPTVQKGRRVYFRKEEIIKSIEDNK